MPLFTVVVPAYNSADYLSRCLGSIKRQGWQDWEAIVVVDGSPDDSAKVARSLSEEDARIRVVEKESNEGIHRARMTGVECAKGDYLFFLDADDELHEGCLDKMAAVVREDDLDILHVGINVIGVGVPEKERAAFEAYINKELPVREGRAICDAAYNAREDYLQDWRLTQRLYKTDLLKRSFSLMTRDRLGRNEDGYEYFVTSCLASREVTRNDIVALDYYYGRGLNSADALSAEKFVSTAEEFRACLRGIESFADSFDGFDVTECVQGAWGKAMDLLFNDWRNRLLPQDQLSAASAAAEVLGTERVATQLLRLARDFAYESWDLGRSLTSDFSFVSWYRHAEEMMRESQTVPSDAYEQLRRTARDHICDLEHRVGVVEVASDKVAPIRSSDYEAQDIRIFVTTHKDVDVFYSNVLQPVQVGWANPRKRLLWAYQDDTGSNISERNAQYCELTSQYWAWKNVDAEYYGFCHYRRYFDFSEEEHQQNPYGEVMDDRIGWDTQERYHLDDASIERAVRGYDVITTRINDVSAFPEHYQSLSDHYDRAPYLDMRDLRCLVGILKEMHPDYASDADAFLAGNAACFCNMFIMRKDLFFRYCEWLFPMLDRFVEGWDTSHVSHERMRTPGHLSERLLNIFLMHERRVNPDLKSKELQCVHFEHPERTVRPECVPMDAPTGLSVVPVVLAADNAYVPMLTTTVYSMLKNASSERCYDIVVLEKDISSHNKDIMRSFFSAFSHASLRFANVSGVISAYDLSTSNEHISVETYYRFLIQDVLPGYDKVLYLDSDLIIQGDVAELFDTDMGANLISAVIDIDYLGNLNMSDGKRLEYSRQVLGLRDPYGYFQAGVLVMNTAGLRGLHSVEEWLKIASEPKYIYDDQDILNASCQGRVTYLDNSWNVMNDCGGRIRNVFTFAPADVYDRFMEAYAHPRIVHYAGFEKPWKPGPCDFRELYWHYARETPFYESLLAMQLGGDRPHGRVPASQRLKELLDPLLPAGTRRRELARSLFYALRGRG